MKNLSDERLLSETARISKQEKEMTLLLLEHLHEVERRHLYAVRAYASLWDYVHRGLGYSESQTSERVNAMRLLFRSEVEGVREALESNVLSLTTAAKIQRFIQVEERQTRKKLSMEEKSELVQECLGKSSTAVERTLFQHSEVQTVHRESERMVSSEQTELRFTIGEEDAAKLARLKELVGNRSLSELFGMMLDLALEKKEPQVTAPAKVPDQESCVINHVEVPKSRYIPRTVQRQVIRRSQQQCEYRDRKTGQRCPSRYRLQFEHALPYALGGPNTPNNLKHFCANHNRLTATQRFGEWGRKSKE